MRSDTLARELAELTGDGKNVPWSPVEILDWRMGMRAADQSAPD